MTSPIKSNKNLDEKMKIKIPEQKSLKKQADNLWMEIIKLRAGYKSELLGILGKKAGGREILASHHIFGKSNNRLRYDLKNGICLLNGREHLFGVHNHNPEIANEYFNKIKDYIGQETYEYLQSLKNVKDKTDLKIVLIYLESEYRKLHIMKSVKL
jgi:hypothetical protein